MSREDPASCSFSFPNRIHKSFKGSRAQACVISHGDRGLGRQSACPTSSVLTQNPGESGFPKSLPPRLLTFVAWSLPDLFRFCSDREGQLAAKWFCRRQGIPSSAQGRRLSDMGISAASCWGRRSGPASELAFSMEARSLATSSCQDWSWEP